MSECDGEILKLPGLVAHRHNLGVLIENSTILELLPGDAVDDVELLLRAVLGADEVELVVLHVRGVHVHIDHMVRVVQTKYRVGAVPEDEVILDDVRRLAADRHHQDADRAGRQHC